MKKGNKIILSVLIVSTFTLSSCDNQEWVDYKSGEYTSDEFSFGEEINLLTISFRESEEQTVLYNSLSMKDGGGFIYYDVGVTLNSDIEIDEVTSYRLSLYQNQRKGFMVSFLYNENEYRYRGYFKEKKDETFIKGEFELAAEDENGLIYYPYGSIELNLY